MLRLLSFTKKGSLPITKVGERLMVHPTGITKLVDKLEQHGLVRRIANPDDRRGTLAQITPKGRARVEQATEAVTEIRFGADLADTDLEYLVDLVRRWRERSGDL